MGQRKRGLLGGSGQVWLELGLDRVSFDSQSFLDPVASEEDRAALASFLEHPLVEVEVGCGRGHFIEDMAREHPDRHFLVIEARARFARMALKRLDRLMAAGTVSVPVDSQASNVRVVVGDARELLSELVPKGRLSALYLLFPDPWWKKKHEKKRVASVEFFSVVRDRLKPEGLFIFRSDVEAYVERFDGFVGEVAGLCPGVLGAGAAMSHRQKKCIELNIPTWERVLKRTAMDPEQGGTE